jgi:hypothetical protein
MAAAASLSLKNSPHSCATHLQIVACKHSSSDGGNNSSKAAHTVGKSRRASHLALCKQYSSKVKHNAAVFHRFCSNNALQLLSTGWLASHHHHQTRE